jgi:DNA-binding beta-propeller fold protein YncE
VRAPRFDYYLSMTHLHHPTTRPARTLLAVTGLLIAVTMINTTVISAAAAPHRIAAELPGLLPDASVAAIDSRTGIVYVIDQRIDQIQVFEPAGSAPVTSIAARGNEPVALIVDSFLRLLYVLYDDGPSVQIFDIANPEGPTHAMWQSEVSLATGCDPHGFALDAVGHQLLVVGEGCSAVTVIDTDDLAVSTIPGDFSDTVALDVTRRVFFTSNRLTGRIRSFNADSHGLEREVAGFGDVQEVILDLDHYRLFLLSGPEVLEWDVRDSSVTHQLSNGQDSVIDVDFDRSSRTVFLLSRSGTLTTIDRSGGAIRPERTGGFTRPTSMARDAFAGLTYVLCPSDGVIRVARS